MLQRISHSVSTKKKSRVHFMPGKPSLGSFLPVWKIKNTGSSVHYIAEQEILQK